jgi:DNA-binding NarL/FixJ family response regulator
MELLLHPAAPHAAVAIGLTVSLYLFVQLKLEVSRQAAQWKREREAIEEENRRMRAGLDTALEEIKLPRIGTAAPVAKPGMNLTRRAQVIRMHRRGERPEQIAAALGLPRNEVDLVLKVSRMASA